jgi:glycosyltransferase involved in cell wall biosynthesis
VVGYVGRLTTEKNIRFFLDLESELLARGCRNFRIAIVGQGADGSWLRKHLRHADFMGVLQGEPLAEAYANFDVFAFPSRTDTFGNVVLEALASGVPAVVTNSGGPKYIVQHGETGLIAGSDEEFFAHVAALGSNREMCQQMSRAARARALVCSWDEVFRHVYDVYEATVSQGRVAQNLIPDWVRA